VTWTRGARPHTAVHRSDGLKSPQPRTFPIVLGIALLAGWACIAAAEGGQSLDRGDGSGGAGTTAAFLALALGTPAALAALGAARDSATLKAAPTRMAVGSLIALAAWTMLSILWSSAPDLSWIEGNETMICLAALAAGIGLGATVPRAPVRMTVGISAAAALPVLWGLGTKVLPGPLGAGDRDLARLSAPLEYPNALALVAVIAVPGALWIAATQDGEAWWRRAARPLAAAWISLLLVTLLLTYSRGGLIALALAAAIAIAWMRRPFAAVTALAAGAAGAILPAVQGLTAHGLTTDALPVADREGAGIGLGWRLVVGMLIAAGIAWVTRDRRFPFAVDGRRALAVAAASLALLVAAVGVAAAAHGGVRDWVGDRTGLSGGDSGAVGNEADRVLDAGVNQRGEWWQEAMEGFIATPLNGQGAGTFPLVHLRYRDNSIDALNPRDPHGLIPRVLSGLGIVGLILLAALAIGIGRGVRRAMRRGPKGVVALPLAVLAAIAVPSLFDRTFAVPALTVPAFAAAGVLLAAAAPGRARRPRRRAGPVGAAVGAGLTVVVIASALLPWWSARAVAAGNRALAESRPQDALDDAAAARGRNPLSLAPLRLRALANADVGDRAASLAAYRDMVELQPENPQAWELLALALGDDPGALQAWVQVLVHNPHDQRAFGVVAAITKATQDAEAAAGGRAGAGEARPSGEAGAGDAGEEPGGPPPARSGGSSSTSPGSAP
jgi:O-antigen ligase